MDLGFVTHKGDGHKLKLPEGLPSEPGVYQLIVNGAPRGLGQIYVGEGQNLLKRLKNYENAGYKPNKFARTNRRVQGWIFNCVEQGHSVRLLICTNAKINQVDEIARSLPLEDKHSRTLIESFVRAYKSNLQFENK